MKKDDLSKWKLEPAQFFAIFLYFCHPDSEHHVQQNIRECEMNITMPLFCIPFSVYFYEIYIYAICAI